ncbi:Essential MCU regulator, mitochondrial [Geodia barretti]|uniref:Essential MCU regulator, mitochondrial n=1 Tax=Geodia barretti TaxID=519541 RepID=A0AA35X435_GEOBA|nr:Essential MCU regulator, mitochondrial [Geodia barretti]
MSGGLLRGLLLRPGGLGALRAVPRRTAVTTESGSILSRPERPYRSAGAVMVAIWAPPFIYGGAMIAKFFASWMEEMNIFVPDDDDDDD